MAETFNAYHVNNINTNVLTPTVVVPNGIVGSNTINNTSTGSSGTRDVGSVCEIHSILVSQRKTNMTNGTVHLTSIADIVAGTPLPDEYQCEAQAVFFNIFVEEQGKKCYLLVDAMLPYQNSFYFDKTITLLPSQSLNIEFIGKDDYRAGKNGDSRIVDVFASTADLT